MFRILVFLFLIGVVALGLGILIEQPGSLSLTWFGYRIDTSPLVGLGVVALGAVVLWSVFRFVFNLPSLVSVSTRARKRARGHEALARGIIAAGVGDARKARKASLDAKKLAPHEPLTLLLEAQAAQLSGDRAGARARFPCDDRAARHQIARACAASMPKSLRQGDHDRAHQIALQAQNITPLAWSGQAVLDRYTAQNDWEAARLCVDQNVRAKLIHSRRPTARRPCSTPRRRWNASRPIRNAPSNCCARATKKAPDLVPATALLARLLSRSGDFRAASKLIEAAYAKSPHPDLAKAYVEMRHGDSSADRLARAKALAKLRAQ